MKFTLFIFLYSLSLFAQIDILDVNQEGVHERVLLYCRQNESDSNIIKDCEDRVRGRVFQSQALEFCSSIESNLNLRLELTKNDCINYISGNHFNVDVLNICSKFRTRGRIVNCLNQIKNTIFRFPEGALTNCQRLADESQILNCLLRHVDNTSANLLSRCRLFQQSLLRSYETRNPISRPPVRRTERARGIASQSQVLTSSTDIPSRAIPSHIEAHCARETHQSPLDRCDCENKEVLKLIRTPETREQSVSRTAPPTESATPAQLPTPTPTMSGTSETPATDRCLDVRTLLQEQHQPDQLTRMNSFLRIIESCRNLSIESCQQDIQNLINDGTAQENNLIQPFRTLLNLNRERLKSYLVFCLNFDRSRRR